MPTCKNCNAEFANYVKIDDKVRNVSKRAFCLTCSPFGKHNTKQLHIKSPVEIGEKICPRCLHKKSIEHFYKRRHGTDFSSYCKSCTLNETIERLQRFKQKCVEYKGGKCESCGYNKCNAALDFHHINPSEKDFTIAQCRTTSFNERVKKELDKCSLLCSNCHREIHNAVVARIG